MSIVEQSTASKIVDVSNQVFSTPQAGPYEISPELKEHIRRWELCTQGFSHQQKAAFGKKIVTANLASMQASAASIVDAFRNERWDDPIFRNEEFKYYAASAYLDRLLTDEEYRIFGSAVYDRLNIPSKVDNTDLTCRLSKVQKDTLTAKLESLPNVDQSITTFLLALSRGDWKAPVFDDENFPHYALLAHMQGLITINQLGTIQTYWMLLQERKKIRLKLCVFLILTTL